MIKREPNKYDLSKVTLWLLCVAMVAMFGVPIKQAYDYSVESSVKTEIAEGVVAPKLSFAEVDAEVDVLKEQGMRLEDADYTQYFIILQRLNMLELTARVMGRQGVGEDRYRATGLLFKINFARNEIANTFLPRFNTETNAGPVFNSPEFKQAQATVEDRWKLVAQATPPMELSFVAVARTWAYAYLACLPFAFLGVCIQLQRRSQATPLEIFFTFLGDYRPIVAILSGPFCCLAIPMMYMHREKLVVNMKLVTHALCGLLSCFIGGVGVAKAQKPDPNAGKKKSTWSLSVLENGELDQSGYTNMTVVDLDHKPTGTTLEGIVVKGGGGFLRTYGLVVKRVATVNYGKLKASIAAVGGVETFKTGGVGNTVYAVMGARAQLQWKKFSWSTPHFAYEQPLAGPGKQMFAVLTRPGVNVTPKVKIVNEWFGRFTVGKKPSVTVGAFVNIATTKKTTVEFGPYRTNRGLTGFRARLIYSF